MGEENEYEDIPSFRELDIQPIVSPTTNMWIIKEPNEKCEGKPLFKVKYKDAKALYQDLLRFINAIDKRRFNIISKDMYTVHESHQIYDAIVENIITTCDDHDDAELICDLLNKNHSENLIKKHHVHIYRIDAFAELDVEAGTPEEARELAKMMLNNKPYSDIDESDFKDPDTEFIFMTFDKP